jgi:hypothetical protein
MQNSIRAAGAAALLVAVVAVNPAHADRICDQFGWTVVVDKYVVQNNLWNPNGPLDGQCIDVVAGSPGFKITKETSMAATNGPPLGYPNIYIGCRYLNCSPGTNLPMQLKSIRSAKSAIMYTYVSNATFDASYDIWLDPTPRKNDVSEVEVMIWLKHQGHIQPIGVKKATVTIHDIEWDVWAGSNGGNDVISYVCRQIMGDSPQDCRVSGIDKIMFSVLDFLADARMREANNGEGNPPGKKLKITDDWWLTGIQAGFEPWQGGVGLAVDQFVATVEPKPSSSRMPSPRHFPTSVSDNEED